VARNISRTPQGVVPADDDVSSPRRDAFARRLDHDPGRTVELAEVLGLANRAFALIDRETGSADESMPAHRLAFLSDCAQLGIEAMATERRALEDYLSTSALQKAFGAKCRELGPFEAGDTASGWNKGESWRAARGMMPQEIRHTDIGEFLLRL